MKKRILERIQNKEGSTLIITMGILLFLVIGTVAFWQAVATYKMTVHTEQIEKQSYLSARSVCQTLANLIIDDDRAVENITDLMTPPVDDDTLWDSYLWTQPSVLGDDTIYLGEVTFDGNPFEMGIVTAQITQHSWNDYELIVTADVSGDVSTVKATIAMDHTVTRAEIDGEDIVITKTEIFFEGGETTTERLEDYVYDIPAYAQGISYLYTDYGIEYGSVGGSSDLTEFTIPVSDAIFGSSQPLIFSGVNSLVINGGLFSKSDIYLGAGWPSVEETTQFLSKSNIVLDGVSFGGALLHAEKVVELRGNVSIGTAEIVCDTFVLAAGASLSDWGSAKITANTVVFEAGSSCSMYGTIYANDVIYGAGATCSTTILDKGNTTTPEIDEDYDRFTPSWADINSSTYIYPSTYSGTYRNGSYYYLPDNLPINTIAVDFTADESGAPVVFVVKSGQTVSIPGYSEIDEGLCFLIQGTGIIRFEQAAGYFNIFVEQPDTALHNEIMNAYASAISGVAKTTYGTAISYIDMRTAVQVVTDTYKATQSGTTEASYGDSSSSSSSTSGVVDFSTVPTWSRDMEANGECVPGCIVEYGGKYYLQSHSETSYWSMPGVDTGIWVEITEEEYNATLEPEETTPEDTYVETGDITTFGYFAVPQSNLHGTVITTFIDRVSNGYIFGETITGGDDGGSGSGSTGSGSNSSTTTESETTTGVLDNEYGLTNPGDTYIDCESTMRIYIYSD